MATENNNFYKELYSRPAILEVVLDEFGQTPISFLELLGDGTGAEYYSTWLNVDKQLYLVERDTKKFDAYDRTKLAVSHLAMNCDLSEAFDDVFRYAPLDVVNLDFCTFLWDNGKDNCTVSTIDKMFECKAVNDGGLVFFTFMIQGLGVNLAKVEVIKNRDDMFNTISDIASKYGYSIEQKLYYTYKSSCSTTMANLGIKVVKGSK